MVSDDAALTALTSGPDGIVAGLGPGKVYVDMSTVSPAASTEVAAQVTAAGAEMLDAPVSGSLRQAEAGTLAIMVGGSADAFGRAEPLLRRLGQTVTHIGANGEGLVLKARVPLFLDPHRPAWFDMGMMHKDIRLAQAAGASLGSPTPTAGLADRVLERARSLGYADRDIAAFGEVLARDVALTPVGSRE